MSTHFSHKSENCSHSGGSPAPNNLNQRRDSDTAMSVHRQSLPSHLSSPATPSFTPLDPRVGKTMEAVQSDNDNDNDKGTLSPRQFFSAYKAGIDAKGHISLDDSNTTTTTTTTQDTPTHEREKAVLRTAVKNMLLSPMPLPHFRTVSGASSDLNSSRQWMATNSPFAVDQDALNVPSYFANDPRKSGRHGATYYVRQTQHHSQCYFDTDFLSLRIGDSVVFNWFDSAHHVYESDRTYSVVMPGGRHSVMAPPSDAASVQGAGCAASESHDPISAHMVFETRFTVPGDFYFVCSRNKSTMRLHVQVIRDRSYLISCGCVVSLVVATVVICIVLVVSLLAYWLQKKDLFVSRENAGTETEYEAFKDLQRIITLYFFPWCATGLFVFLIVIVLRLLRPAFSYCYRLGQRSSHRRGVSHTVRRASTVSTIVLCLATVVLLFTVYVLELKVTDGLNYFSQQLSSSIVSTINAFLGVTNQVNWLVAESETLFPGVNVPKEEVDNVLDLIGGVLNTTYAWTTTIEAIAQSAFRAMPILVFLMLQMGLFASSLAIGAVVLKYRRPTQSVAWIFAVCIGVYACSCGAAWALTKLLAEVYDSAVIFEAGPDNLAARWGLSDKSMIGSLFDVCRIDNSTVGFALEYVQDVMHSINATLDTEGQEAFSEIFDIISDVVPIGLEALANFTNYIQANIDLLVDIVNKNGPKEGNFFPFLTVLFSVISTVEGLANCQILRDVVASAIPILKDNVDYYNRLLTLFMFILFGISVLTLASAAFSAFALANPRKTWYESRTGRWFCLRYAYKVHHRLVLKTPQAAAEQQRPQDLMDAHTVAKPFMYRLLTVKLVCYSASVLMFFDSILLALFSSVTRTLTPSPLIRATAYLGCTQLIFLLLAALFQQLWLRRLLHGITFTIVLGVFSVAMVQAVYGFINFSSCLRFFTRLGDPTQRSLECSAMYTGHQLEVAIYASVLLMNSVTLCVTLLLLLLNEQRLKASFQRRPYVGFLSPLGDWSACFRPLLEDYLHVKRVYVGVFIVFVVLLLALITVADTTSFTIIELHRRRWTTGAEEIIQVIDPTIGCNGDPKYCSLGVNQFIWATTHNSHSALEENYVAANHYYGIPKQLHAGVRSFMIDLWYDVVNSSVSTTEVDVYTCHTVCMAGRTPFRQIAAEFKAFLDRYPRQVLLVNIEQYVNTTDIGRIMAEVGLARYAWRTTQDAPNQNPNFVWPTLEGLIASGQRLMVFNDVPAVSNLSRGSDEYDFLHFEYGYQYENSYNTPDVSLWRCEIGRGWCDDELVYPGARPNETDYGGDEEAYMAALGEYERLHKLFYKDKTNCMVDDANKTELWKNGSYVYNAHYGGNPPHVASKLSTMNHMITNTIGSPVQASKANEPKSIQATTLNCSSQWNAVVNILAFDFWSIAEPLATINDMNQNVAAYGRRYHFKDAWEKIYFGR